MAKARRRSKYRAVRTRLDGFTFASKAEARRYQALRLLEQAGTITGLELQPRFKLAVNGVTVCHYVGDFAYTDTTTGRPVLEDVKGVLTPIYRLKKRLMRAVHGIEIMEVRA